MRMLFASLAVLVPTSLLAHPGLHSHAGDSLAAFWHPFTNESTLGFVMLLAASLLLRWGVSTFQDRRKR